MFSLELLSNPFFWIFTQQLDSLVNTLGVLLALVSVIWLVYVPVVFVHGCAFPFTKKQLVITTVVLLVGVIFIPSTETVYKAMAYSTGANAVQTFSKSPQAKELNSISLNALKRLNEVLDKTEKETKEDSK
jgi:hypothetical protein